jgi:hypothetical protein
MRNPNAPYVTLSGLPVRVELQWPFHASTSGADWFSLHARVWLADGRRGQPDSGLHAEVAVNVSQTIKEALPSLEPQHAESAAVNAIRKELDVRQLELLKSSKRIPVHVSSRFYDAKRQRLIFARADDEQLREFLMHKTWWAADRSGRDTTVWLTDPFDLEYLNTNAEQMMAAAQRLATEDLIVVEDDHARATDALIARADEVIGAMQAALQKLEAKHAFEHG